MARTFAVDVGGTQVKWAVVDQDYGTPERGSVKTDFQAQDQLVGAIVELAQRQQGQVDGIALSVPGTIIASDPDGTVIGGALRYMDGCPLGRLVAQKTGKPTVVVNDGKACALGEYAMGALRGCSVGVALAIGTGLGGGIVVDGRVLSGSHGFAGEFSFIPTVYENGLVPQTMAAIGLGWMGLRGEVCSRKGISGADLDAVDGRKVFEWINAGDPSAVAGLDAYARRFAMLLFSLQTTVDPKLFALGGGISAQPALFRALDAAIDAMYEPWPLKQLPRPRVVRAQFGNDANLFGATYEFRRRQG